MIKKTLTTTQEFSFLANLIIYCNWQDMNYVVLQWIYNKPSNSGQGMNDIM